jgi:amidase
MDVTLASATEISGAIARKEVSSREVLDQLLARVDELNPAINAVVALDVERARAAAAAADDATARGDVLGPLHGVPMTVKDVWETEGLVTTSGAPELKDHVPSTDAIAVGRLKDAGAVIFGKTNTPLYAGDFQTYNEVYGRTNNPRDTSRTVGGSSGGSAAAVAAGMTPIELGSDIGGSIRIPSHFNGVYGLKPSWGLVPSRGHIPGPPGSLVEADVNCNGPIARSLDDLRTGIDVLAGPLPEDAVAWRVELEAGPPVDPTALRIATVFDQGRDLIPVSSEVTASLEAFAGRLGDAGIAVEARSLPVPLTDGMRSWQDMVLPIIGMGMPDEIYDGMAELADVPGDDITLSAGRAIVARYRTWARANQQRQLERAAWAAMFERYDAVLAPIMPTTAFPHDTERDMLERELDVDGVALPHRLAIAWCGAIGSVLLPVVALPTGPASDGLPVGVQVVGPYLTDVRLIEIARRLDEAAGPGFVPPPA